MYRNETITNNPGFSQGLQKVQMTYKGIFHLPFQISKMLPPLYVSKKDKENISERFWEEILPRQKIQMPYDHKSYLFPISLSHRSSHEAIKTIYTPRIPCCLETRQYLPCPPPVPHSEHWKQNQRLPRTSATLSWYKKQRKNKRSLRGRQLPISQWH